MSRYVADYFWKNGIPYPLSYTEAEAAISYKIISDPYHKHISIEKYFSGLFSNIVYDSMLLDFRKLQPQWHLAWQRSLLREDAAESVYLLSDHNDRATFIESCFFEDSVCRKCLIHSTHGTLLSTHCLFYTSLQDSFDGVELYDSEGHLVMRKWYDPIAHEPLFGLLLQEDWNPLQLEQKL